MSHSPSPSFAISHSIFKGAFALPQPSTISLMFPLYPHECNVCAYCLTLYFIRSFIWIPSFCRRLRRANTSSHFDRRNFYRANTSIFPSSRHLNQHDALHPHGC